MSGRSRCCSWPCVDPWRRRWDLRFHGDPGIAFPRGRGCRSCPRESARRADGSGGDALDTSPSGHAILDGRGQLSSARRSETSTAESGPSPEPISKLGASATGMEFASEFLVRAVQRELTIEQVPVPYRRRDGGDVKLRTFLDGGRHLRLIVGMWRSEGGRVVRHQWWSLPATPK